MNIKGRPTAEISRLRKLWFEDALKLLHAHARFLNEITKGLRNRPITINSQINFEKAGWSKRRQLVLNRALLQIELMYLLALGYEFKSQQVKRTILVMLLGGFTLGSTKCKEKMLEELTSYYIKGNY